MDISRATFRRLFFLGLLICSGFFVPTRVGAATTTNTRQPEVKILSAATGKVENSFLAFGERFRGGATVAIGDINGDKVNEIIVGAGVGGGPQVRVFQADGTLLTQFFAYPKTFHGGVKVSSCDFDADGVAEILVSPGEGGSSQIRVLTWWGEPKFTPGFLAFNKAYKGGVNSACGDVTGDGIPDIIAGVGAGETPIVKVFDRYGKIETPDIFPFTPANKGGVDVAVGNTDGKKASEIIMTAYRFGTSGIEVYRIGSKITKTAAFTAWGDDRGGFHPTSGDVNGDRRADILLARTSGGASDIQIFKATGASLTQKARVYEKGFLGGVTAAIGDVTGDGIADIVTVPGRNVIEGSPANQKYVDVSLGGQRLTAYENGKIIKTFLVSTGIKKYPTPTGAFSVLAKIPKKDYQWTYGPNHPDNYDIKDVQWNLRFAPTLYLHYAFWHHNFGHVMSHGCVNMDLTSSEWIYPWADIGMPVIIHK